MDDTVDDVDNDADEDDDDDNVRPQFELNLHWYEAIKAIHFINRLKEKGHLLNIKVL